MKRINSLLVAVLFITGLHLHAQNILTGSEANNLINGAEMVRTGVYGDAPSFIKYRQGNLPAVNSYLNSMEKRMKLDDNMQFVSVRTDEDQLGYAHYRFTQQYNGIPVEFTSWYVHTKNGEVHSANGFIHRSLPNAQAAVLSEAQAVQYALNYIGATTYKWQVPGEENHLKAEQGNPEATYYPQPTLVFAPSGNDYAADVYRIAYKMNIYAQEPLSRQIVYVDAVTGEIFNTIEQIHVADVNGTAITGYSGSRTITTDSFGANNFRLRESGRGNGVETYNMQQGTSYATAVDFTDSDNTWNNVNAQLDEYATDAHFGAEMTYDYLMVEHNRNSIDNMGFKLVSYVHYSTSFNNAFWDGQRMTYGDGNGAPLTTMDISGHEITHGLTNNTADLIYNAESGALNESFSDIFGTAVERFGRPNNWNWTIGEDLGAFFRSMIDPNSLGDPDTYFGNNWASLTGGDNGGVHTNSSVQNYWFYLLSAGGSGTNDLGNAYNVTGLGFSKAEDIAFRNLTVYLTPNSNFADARFFAIQAAVDLYGPCTPEVGSVTDAWYAVGVGAAYVPYTVADFETQITTSCTAPFTVQFQNNSLNGSTFLWNFGDGSTSTSLNPVHTYNSLGNYTVSLNAMGGACGNDDTTKVNYIVVSDTIPCIVTLPAFGQAITQTACSGTLFDSGGPNGNYGANESSQIVIAPAGAGNITLNFVSFSVEAGTGGSCNYDDLRIYDGPDNTAPLIGVYCDNNIPTTITSTSNTVSIFFSSDGGVEQAGFEMTWNCNIANAAPVANFINDFDVSCTGDIAFSDISSNLPSTWLWDFGDGQTSTVQHPVHHYNASGTYTVALTAGNSFGNQTETKLNLITINLEPAPTTVSDTVCPGGNAVLAATSTGLHRWFADAYADTSVFTGDTFTTPSISVTTPFFVDEQVISPLDSVGPVDNTFGGGNSFSGDQHLIFNVANAIILESVLVYATGSGDRTIQLRDANGTILESVTVNIPDGAHRINLNFAIQPGTDYQLATANGSQPNLFRNNTGVSFPYSLPSVTITISSAGSGFYYFFYNWKVRDISCLSPRQAVDAVVDECTGISEQHPEWSVSVYPNPANDEINIRIAGYKAESKAKVSVLNAIGQEVTTVAVTSETTQVAISELSKGVYFVKITLDEVVQIEKLIVQ